MRSEIIDKFNDEVIKKAITHIDKDKMAKKLAKLLESHMLKGFDEMVAENFDFQYWLENELTNDKTPAGKSFNTAMKSIAKKMADSIAG